MLPLRMGHYTMIASGKLFSYYLTRQQTSSSKVSVDLTVLATVNSNALHISFPKVVDN